MTAVGWKIGRIVERTSERTGCMGGRAERGEGEGLLYRFVFLVAFFRQGRGVKKCYPPRLEFADRIAMRV